MLGPPVLTQGCPPNLPRSRVDTGFKVGGRIIWLSCSYHRLDLEMIDPHVKLGTAQNSDLGGNLLGG